MAMKICLTGCAIVALALSAPAQAGDQEPLLIVPQQPDDVQYLPANTEVVVAMNDTLTTKGKSFQEGDTFGLTVLYPVFLDDVVVIPKGARATGRISWLTSKGAFGKSGKMEIDIEYVEVNGRRIPLEGHFRQEGEGNTVATVGGVVAVGLLAGFITGKSGVIPRGRELTVHTREDVPVRIARLAPAPAPLPAYAPSAYSRAELAAATPPPAPPAAKKPKKWGLEAVDPK
jgi:hypothetical protein